MKAPKQNEIDVTVSKAQKKVYSSPVLSVYGNIERQTAGGSGTSSEGGMTDMMTKFP